MKGAVAPELGGLYQESKRFAERRWRRRSRLCWLGRPCRKGQERDEASGDAPMPAIAQQTMAGAIMQAADVGVVGRDVVQLFLHLGRRDAQSPRLRTAGRPLAISGGRPPAICPSLPWAPGGHCRRPPKSWSKASSVARHNGLIEREVSQVHVAHRLPRQRRDAHTNTA